VISGAFTERWSAINAALQNGCRGLAGDSSLAQLLAEHRGVRNPKGLPRLTVGQVLKWCDEYHERNLQWPHKDTAPRQVIPGSPGERWKTVDDALRRGRQGLPGRSSLARLLAEHRGVRNHLDLPRLTVRQILRWCDEFHERTGKWPRSGGQSYRTVIPGPGGETWSALNHALRDGLRGLPGGSSLAQLLAEHRGVPNHLDRPRLTVRQILQWADAWHERTGHWPRLRDWRAEIPGSGGETWNGVFQAVQRGGRGLPGGLFSFWRLLAEHRGVRNIQNLPDLTVEQILAWADAYHRKAGEWPTCRCEPQEIPGTGGEKWFNVHQALQKGLRGLPGGSSLARLLAEHRGVRNQGRLPRLTVQQILAWADAVHEQTGEWPTSESSRQEIPGSGGERWAAVDHALYSGHRGLPGGSSLAALLARHRGVRNIHRLPRLTVKQILAWADTFHVLTGAWPTVRSSPREIPETSGERWTTVDDALRKGTRGLPGGSSLAQLLADHRGVPNQNAPRSYRMTHGRR
jgi:hypothetical protein